MTDQSRADSYPELSCEVRGCSHHAVTKRVIGALADHPGLPDGGAARGVLLCYEHFAELVVARDPDDHSAQ